MTRPLATGYKACFEFHGPLDMAWNRNYWSMSRKDGAVIITVRTDNGEFDWKDQSLTYKPDADDWQHSTEGRRLIDRCLHSMKTGIPARLIMRDREHGATPTVDPRWYWGIITHVGTGDELGHISGKVLPLDAYDPTTKTFQGK